MGELQPGGSDNISNLFDGIETSGGSDQNRKGRVGACTSTLPELVRLAARKSTQQLATYIREPADNMADRLGRTPSQTWALKQRNSGTCNLGRRQSQMELPLAGHADYRVQQRERI